MAMAMRIDETEITISISKKVKPDWDLSGALDDLTFMYHMGARRAATDEGPEWSATSEFRAIREQQRPGP